MDIVTLAMTKQYTDSQRLAYTEVVKSPVFLEPVTFVGNTQVNAPFPLTIEEMLALNGKEVQVCLNGVEYPYTIAYNKNGGNAVGFRGINNAPVFAVYVFSEQLWNIENDSDPENTSTVSIYMKTETIHPIEAKYLPGVCLPVVEISTVLTLNSTVALTEEEGAMLDAAVAQNLPVVIRLKLKDNGSDDESAQTASILASMSSDFYGTGYPALVAQFVNISAVFAGSENGWMAVFDVPNTTDGGTDG